MLAYETLAAAMNLGNLDTAANTQNLIDKHSDDFWDFSQLTRFAK